MGQIKRKRERKWMRGEIERVEKRKKEREAG